jgi:peptidoglycan-associated lipoprotein
VPLTENEIFARKSLDQLNAEKPLGDVFFDFDRSDIRNEGRSAMQRDADWMKKYPSTIVTVEGTATREAAPSTISRSATAARPP